MSLCQFFYKPSPNHLMNGFINYLVHLFQSLLHLSDNFGQFILIIAVDEIAPGFHK
jgi:hypothetical protein